MRFLQHQFAVSADIEGMFLQVGVLPCDQPLFALFVVRGCQIGCEYLQHTWLIFSALYSPACVNFAIQQTGRDNVEKFPEASKAVLIRFYKEDYLYSFDICDDAMRKSKELVKLLNLVAFHLTKFDSYFPIIQEKLNPSIDITAKEKILACVSVYLNSYVLGLKWNQGSYSLVVRRGANYELQTSVTQRTVFKLFIGLRSF